MSFSEEFAQLGELANTCFSLMSFSEELAQLGELANNFQFPA